jgi:hypothetical protein
MTHFVGIVVADNDDELAKVLAPYDEGLEVESYFYALNEDALARMAQFYKKDPDDLEALKGLMADWTGNDGLIQDGKVGYMTSYNPDSKWDWYKVGGRWDGIVPNNRCKASEVAGFFESRGYVPSALVSEQGWIATKDWGWWGAFEELSEGPAKMQAALTEYADKNCFIVDFHI